MKRNKFIKFCITGLSVAATPFTALGNFVEKFRVDKGIRVTSGKDRFNKPIYLFGLAQETFHIPFRKLDPENQNS